MTSIPTGVPGLTLYSDFLDAETEKAIVTWIDQQPWNTTLKRRTQHYGYEYNYAGRGNAPLTPTTPLSGPIMVIGQHLASLGLFTAPGQPSQCIINEYTRAQGIAAHTDARVFGPTIVSISLLVPTMMIFSCSDQTVRLILPPRSCLVMTGQARTSWRHEIPANVTFPNNDGTIYHKANDYRRLSLTYREVTQ